MTPYEQAQAVYEREPCARTFHEDLWYHLQHGFVWASPACFAMIRPVCSTWERAALLSPWLTAPDGDCWLVWMLAGDAAEGIAKLPSRKKWLAFERSGSLYTVDAERFQSRLRRAALRARACGLSRQADPIA